jgi:hypothetical protein
MMKKSDLLKVSGKTPGAVNTSGSTGAAAAQATISLTDSHGKDKTFPTMATLKLEP